MTIFSLSWISHLITKAPLYHLWWSTSAHFLTPHHILQCSASCCSWKMPANYTFSQPWAFADTFLFLQNCFYCFAFHLTTIRSPFKCSQSFLLHHTGEHWVHPHQAPTTKWMWLFYRLHITVLHLFTDLSLILDFRCMRTGTTANSLRYLQP